MGLTAAIILIVVLVALLAGLLAFVMSRPRTLRPHTPGGWRPRYLRARRRRQPRTD